VVGHWRGPNRPEGWADLLAWAAALGPVRQWGIEGAGQYGRRLAQYLVAAGEPVWEVNPRQTAALRRGGRQRGTSDRLDAQAVARVVRQEGETLPRVQPSDVTAVLAVLVAERDGALAEATRLRNQLHQVLHQLEPTYQARFSDLTAAAPVAALTGYTAAAGDPVRQAQAGAVRRLARRLQLVTHHAQELTAEIEHLVRVHLQPLVALAGVSWLTAGMLAAYLGPGIRFASDAQLAMDAGVAPVEAFQWRAGAPPAQPHRAPAAQCPAASHRLGAIPALPAGAGLRGAATGRGQDPA